MLWDGPYKERMVGFYLQRVGRLYGVGLRFAFEAFMPAFEVVQAETFHKEFSYPFFGNGFQPIIFTYGGGAVGLITCRTQGCYVFPRFGVLFQVAIGFGSDDVLLGETEYFRHVYMIDIQLDEIFIAMIFDEQRPCETMCISCSLLCKEAFGTQVVLII